MTYKPHKRAHIHTTCVQRTAYWYCMLKFVSNFLTTIYLSCLCVSHKVLLSKKSVGFSVIAFSKALFQLTDVLESPTFQLSFDLGGKDGNHTGINPGCTEGEVRFRTHVEKGPRHIRDSCVREHCRDGKEFHE